MEAKSPNKTSKRRSSTSSTSSHQSQKDKAKKRKYDKDSIVEKDKAVIFLKIFYLKNMQVSRCFGDAEQSLTGVYYSYPNIPGCKCTWKKKKICVETLFMCSS